MHAKIYISGTLSASNSPPQKVMNVKIKEGALSTTNTTFLLTFVI
jgi:hypothetical protein